MRLVWALRLGRLGLALHSRAALQQAGEPDLGVLVAQLGRLAPPVDALRLILVHPTALRAENAEAETALGHVALVGPLVALAALFRIDADTALITSTGTIFGPPFIAPVARALRDWELMVSGLTTGLMGHAVDTCLEFAVAWVLRP